MRDHYLKSIFEPHSVAVIGATERENSVAAQVLLNIREGGFTGDIYPVNPKHKTVQGLACYPSISDIDRPID